MVARLKHLFAGSSQPTHKRKRPQFLAALVRSPLKIGALMPSSRALARAMAAQIDLSTPGMIIELGAGTGAVTYALVEAGIPPERLLVIEREPSLFTILHQQFPQLNVMRADVIELDEVLRERGITEINCIVSSLPLLTMPRGIRSQIETRMCAAIASGGHIIQFTYGAKSPISRERWRSYRIWGKRKKTVMTNVPPAHVWVFRRDRRVKKRD